MEATAVAAAGFSSREHIEMEEKCGKYPSESQGRSRFNYKKKEKERLPIPALVNGAHPIIATIECNAQQSAAIHKMVFFLFLFLSLALQIIIAAVAVWCRASQMTNVSLRDLII